MRTVSYLLPFLLILSSHSFATLHFDCEGNRAKVVLIIEDSEIFRKIDLSYQDRSIYLPILEVETSSNEELTVSGLCNDTKYYRFSLALKTARMPINFSTNLVLSTGLEEDATIIRVICNLEIR